jgi:hypothetical protein
MSESWQILPVRLSEFILRRNTSGTLAAHSSFLTLPLQQSLDSESAGTCPHSFLNWLGTMRRMWRGDSATRQLQLPKPTQADVGSTGAYSKPAENIALSKSDQGDSQ